MVNGAGVSPSNYLATSAPLVALALRLEPFTTPRRSLFLGPCPTELIGIATLHGAVDVVDPHVGRAQSIGDVCPGARILRAPLPDALPRLAAEYDFVFAADPRTFSGRWSWRETVEVIRRISTPETAGMIVVPFDSCEAAAWSPADISAPRNLLEFLDLSGLASTGVWALEALSTSASSADAALIAYCVGDDEANACAATLLADRPVSSELAFETMRNLHARLMTGPLGRDTPCALVPMGPSTLPAVLLAERHGSSQFFLAQQRVPASRETTGTAAPLISKITYELVRGDLIRARDLVQLYRELTAASTTHPPRLGRCVVTGDHALSFVGPDASIADPEVEIRSFCQRFVDSGARVGPRFPDAISLADALLEQER